MNAPPNSASFNIEYSIWGDVHSECVYDYYALKHSKGELTGDDIRGIVKLVKERYPERQVEGIICLSPTLT